MDGPRFFPPFAFVLVTALVFPSSAPARPLPATRFEPLPARAVARGEKPLTNVDIVRLAKKGLSDDIIINAIRGNPCSFDLSADGIVGLMEAGVSQKVVEAMQESQRPASRGPRDVPAEGDTAPAPAKADAGPQNSWGVSAEILQPESRFPLAFPAFRTAQLKDPKADLRAMARDDAVTVAISKASTEAAVRLAQSTGSIMAVGPMIGLGMYAAKFFRRGRAIWTVTFLDGRNSAIVTTDSSPQFELAFDSVPGVNPDDYTATILSVYPTPNNFRIVGKYRYTEKGVLVERIEDRVPVELVPVRRGVIRVRPRSPLPNGEYVIAIVPIAPDLDANGKPTAANASDMTAGLEMMAFRGGAMRWDFAVAATAVRDDAQPALAEAAETESTPAVGFTSRPAAAPESEPAVEPPPRAEPVRVKAQLPEVVMATPLLRARTTVQVRLLKTPGVRLEKETAGQLVFRLDGRAAASLLGASTSPDGLEQYRLVFTFSPGDTGTEGV